LTGFAWGLCLGFSALSVATPDAAASGAFAGFEPGHVRIQIDDLRTEGGSKKRRPRGVWKAGCARLAGALTAGEGPWGLGAFSTASCHVGKKRVSGVSTPTPWTIALSDGGGAVTWTVSYAKREIARLELGPTAQLPRFLADAEYADLVAYALLDRMPMAMALKSAQAQGKPTTVTGRYWRAGRAGEFKFKIPKPPEALTLYRLRWSAGEELWRSEVVGTARRTRLVESVARTSKAGKKSQTGGEVAYQLDERAAVALAKGPLWAHDADGPSARRKEIDAALKAAHADLDDAAKVGRLDSFLQAGATTFGKLLASAASGYVGFRYGLQVLEPEGELGKLLAKTRVIGVLAEVRGGPLRGLRYYYDKLPETKATLEGVDGDEEASIAFARHVLGYSFGFAPGFLVDRITFDPKLGIWTFAADLPVAFDDEGRVTEIAEFRPGRTFSVAGEAGIELLSSWYTVRGWYSLDTGFSLLKSGAKVTSNRLGMDGYFTAGPTFPLFGLDMKTALMAFYLYEAVTLASGEDASLEEGESVIDEIKYSSAYAGGGVAISW
jgi:hypothetical protein